MLKRRGLLIGMGAAVALPAIVRTPGLLMPVKPLVLTPAAQGGEAIRGLTFLGPYPGGLGPAVPQDGDVYYDTGTFHMRAYFRGQWHTFAG